MASYGIGNLVWKITGDDSGINKSLDRTEKKVGKTKSAFNKAAKVIGTALIAVGIGKFTKSLITAASDAEETANKFGVVFSKMSRQANASAKAIADGYGLSRTASKSLLADTGDLLTGFGLTQKEALNLSDQTARLGADLASFTNYAGGAAGATQALTKAMLGEREQAKMLGIAITETELIRFAEEQGKAWKEMERGERAALTLQLAMQQSKNAIGDFQRSIGSYANQMRIAEANTGNLKESLGNVLLPIATLAIRTFNEMSGGIGDAADKLNEFVRSAEGADKIGNVIGNIVASFAAFKTIVQPVLDGIGQAFDDIVDPIKELSMESGDLSVNMNILSGIFIGIGSALQVIGRLIGGTIQYIIDLGKVSFDAGKLINSFFSALRGKGFDDVKKNFDSLIESSKDLGANVADTYGDIANIVMDTVKTFGSESQKLSDDVNKNFIDTFEKAKKAVVESFTAIQGASGDTGKEVEETAENGAKAWEKFAETLKNVNGIIQSGAGEIINLFSGIAAYQDAAHEKRLNQIDAELQAALEAAGVADETAVQQAESNLELAREENDQEAILEAEKELKKAQIQEKYAKKRAKAEYKGQLTRWKWDMGIAAAQIPLSIMNAIASGAQAPWFLQPGFMIGMGVAAGAASGAQMAAVSAAKPEPPKFAKGGIIPGTSSGTTITAGEGNQTEVVMNPDQMANTLMAIGAGGGAGYRRVKPIDVELTWAELYQASKSGDLYIHEDAITNK